MKEIPLSGNLAARVIVPLDLSIKAITIWQPWASLLVDGPKKYETRSWPTNYRGPIAIHAAKRLPRLIEKIVPPLVVEYMRRYLARPLEDLPVGCIIGTAELVACHLIDDKFLSELNEGEERLGDFTLGRYAWEFKNMQVLENPVPAQGKQGLWNWSQGGAHDMGKIESGRSKSQRDR